MDYGEKSRESNARGNNATRFLHQAMAISRSSAVVSRLGLRCIIENPWNTNGQSFLQLNFIRPTIIDKNRMLRGDYFVKPTAYWFVGCNNTNGHSYQQDKQRKFVNKEARHDAGICGEERSMIHPDYARNFICDFILGKVQTFTQQTLF